jgi:hypothetical protein
MLEALACRGPDSAAMAVFSALRPKQLVARVKLGDGEESSRSAPAVEEIARKFRLMRKETWGRLFPMWSRLPRASRL